MTEPYQPLYRWRRTKIDENDPPRDTDWMAYDDGAPVGRVQLQPHGPMKGKWLWSAHGPMGVKRHTPHQGYEQEGREAMRKVEEYYHALLKRGGMEPRNGWPQTKSGNPQPMAHDSSKPVPGD
jgi:hypothetical protein